LIGVKDFGTAAQAGVLGTISMTSYLNDGTSPTNNINFNGNTYNSSSTQVYTGVSGKAFSMQASTLAATTFKNAGANITFNNSVIELAQSDLIVSTNGGNIRALNITSSTTSQNKDVTLNAGNGTVSVGQIGGVSGSYGNLNGVNTVLITGLSGVTLTSNILTSNFTNNSVTLNGPVVINANTTINTSQNTLDTTGSIFLSSTLNALGGVTLTLDASNATQSSNVSIGGLIGAGASGSLGGLTIEGNQIAINGIGSTTQFGVIGSTLVTAANAGSLVGAISFTGTTYRTNGTQVYDASGTNALILNGGINSSLTSFITLDDAVTFNGSFNINLRNLAVDTTNAVVSGVGIGGANINFNGTVSGSAGLSLTAGNAGDVNLTQNVGSGQALTSVVINSSKAINSQAINVGGAGSITLTSDTFNLLGTVSSTSGTITLQPNTLSLPLAINNATTLGDIAITTAVINNFSTSGMVVYGNTLGTGNINLAGASPTSFPYNVTFRTGSAAKINVNGSVITPGKSVTYSGEVVESSNIVVPTTTGPTVKYSVTAINISTAGSGYTSVPTVTITAAPIGGITATATATLTGGVVTAITITNPGSGYVTAPTVTLSAPSGAGTTATATATLGAGVVQDDILFTNGGSGFQSPPAVLLIGGGGTGATAVATVGTQATGVVTVGDKATAIATLGDQAQSVVNLGTKATATSTLGTVASGTANLNSAATASAVAGVNAVGVALLGLQATATAVLGTQASATVDVGTQASATVTLGTLASGVASVGTLAVATATPGIAATASGTVGLRATAHAVLGTGAPFGLPGSVFTIPVDNGGSGYNTGLQSVIISGGTSYNVGDILSFSSATSTTTGPDGQIGVNASGTITQLGTIVTSISVLNPPTGPNLGVTGTTTRILPIVDNTGILGDIFIDSAGTYTPNATFTVNFTGGGSGNNAFATAVTNVNGQITDLTLISGGSGYSGGTLYTITPITGGITTIIAGQAFGIIGSGATATVVTDDNNGAFISATLGASGTGYFNGRTYTLGNGTVRVGAQSLTTGGKVVIGESFRGNRFAGGQALTVSGGATATAFVGPEVVVVLMVVLPLLG